MLDTLSQAFLALTSEPGIIALFLIGYHYYDRATFREALILVLFTMVYNHALKEFWQVPLAPTLNKEGWAFPSGHMHTAVAFLGYSCWPYPRTRKLIPLVLAAIGWALVHRGYHTPADVLAALGYGLITITAARLFVKISPHSASSFAATFLILALLIHSTLISRPWQHTHLFLASGGLCGCLLAVLTLKNLPQAITKHSGKKLPALLTSILGLGLIFSSLKATQGLGLSLQLHTFFFYILIAYWLITSPVWPTLITQLPKRKLTKSPIQKNPLIQ